MLMSFDDNKVPDNSAILSANAKRLPGRPKKNRVQNRGASPKRKIKLKFT